MQDFVVLGDRLGIQSNTKSDVMYISRVEEILDDLVRIAIPMYADKLVLLKIEEKYKVYFYAKDGCYETEMVVKNRVKKGNSYYIDIIVLTDDVKKTQRREYYRFDCVLPLKFVIDRGNLEEEEEVLSGIVKDISGGGIKFVTNTKLQNGVVLKSFLEIKDEFIDVLLKVCYVNKDESDYSYECGAKFKVISEDNKEKILKYIYEEQRKGIVKEANKVWVKI